METDQLAPCARCGSAAEPADAFCSGCGALRPRVLSPGGASVDVLQVPSEKHRTEVAKILKAWFPSIDLFAAEQALKQDSARLIQGVDEDSARRIIDALKSMKVVARPSEPRSSASRFLNGGLLVSALALLTAPWVNLLFSVLLVLVAVAAPVAMALLKPQSPVPIVSLPRFDANAEDWARIAHDYSRVVAQLASEDAKVLQSITRGVFDLRARLSEDSLASVAAGGESGEFSASLREVLLSAIVIAERTLSTDAEQKAATRRELGSLGSLMDESRAWFAELEREGVKKAPQITDEVSEIRSRIDSIVHEVRTVAPGAPRERELG